MCVLVYLRNWKFIVGPLDGMCLMEILGTEGDE